jgi:hypothetical protein
LAIDIKRFRRQLEKSFKESVKELESRQNMTQLGKSLSEDIKKRTRLGYGVEKNGARRQRLAPLSDSYVEQRRGRLTFRKNSKGKPYPISSENKSGKKFLSSNKLRIDSTTSAKKSNLTQSGRMLRSIGVLFTGVGRVVIGFNTRKRAQIAAFVSKVRPFFFATNNEEKRLIKRTQKKLNELISRNIRKNF